MARDYLMAALAQGIGVVAAGAVTIIVSRLLGPGGRGEYAVLSGAVQLLAMFGQLGFGVGAIQMGSREAVPVSRLLRYAQLMMVASGTGGMILLAAAYAARPHWFGSVDVATFAIAAATLPVLLGAQLHTVLFFALHRPTLHSRYFIVQQLVWVTSVAAAALIRPESDAALAAWLGSNLVWLVLIVLQLRQDVAPAPVATLDWRELGRVLAFGAQSTAGLVMQMATSRVSLFIITAQLGKAQAGIYSVATVMAETLWQAVAAVAQVNLPRASAAYARGETPAGAFIASRLAVALSLGAALAIGAAAPLIVAAIFGPTFAAAAGPLRVLLAGTGIYAACLVVGADLLARGYAQFTALASGITLAVSSVLYLVLVPRFGLMGAAAAAALGYLTSTLALIAAHRARTGRPPGELVAVGPRDLLAVWQAVMALLRRR